MPCLTVLTTATAENSAFLRAFQGLIWLPFSQAAGVFTASGNRNLKGNHQVDLSLTTSPETRSISETENSCGKIRLSTLVLAPRKINKSLSCSTKKLCAVTIESEITLSVKKTCHVFLT